MKKITHKIAILLGSACIVAGLSGCPAYTYEGMQQNVNKRAQTERFKYQQYSIQYADPSGTSWKLAGSAMHRDSNNEIIPYGVSYLPAGQTPKNWQESITEEFHPNSAVEQRPLIDMANYDKNSWQQRLGCQVEQWKIIQNTSQYITYSSKLVNCKRGLPQSEMYMASKEFASTDGYYILTYLALSPADSATRQQQIKTMLVNAHLVPAKK